MPSSGADPVRERRRRAWAGFSATNLAVTVAVLGIATLAVLPAIPQVVQTYRRNAAARHVLAEIRRAQSLAVTRGEVFALQWGADPAVGRSPTEYRLVRDTSGSCTLPAASAPEDQTTVIRDWLDLSGEYAGMRIGSVQDNGSQTVGGVMFDSRGASINTCTAVSFPIRMTLEDQFGYTRVIEIRSAGSTRLL